MPKPSALQKNILPAKKDVTDEKYKFDSEQENILLHKMNLVLFGRTLVEQMAWAQFF